MSAPGVSGQTTLAEDNESAPRREFSVATLNPYNFQLPGLAMNRSRSPGGGTRHLRAPFESASTMASEPETPEPGRVPELSPEKSNMVRNADGSYTASVLPPAGQPPGRRWGEWVPISNEVVEAPSVAYAVQNEANDYTRRFRRKPRGVTPVKFELDAAWVTMKLAGSEDVELADLPRGAGSASEPGPPL